VHEYVRIVESVWEDGRVKQKVIANLGRRDVLDSVLPMLHRFLRGEDAPTDLAEQTALSGSVELETPAHGAPCWSRGICSRSWDFWQILDRGRRWPKLFAEEDPHDDWPAACWPC